MSYSIVSYLCIRFSKKSSFFDGKNANSHKYVGDVFRIKFKRSSKISES